MKNHRPIISKLYSALITLYPAVFREPFYEDMQVTFDEALYEAAQSGWKEVAALFFRELLDLPHSVISQYRHEFLMGKEGAVNEMKSGSRFSEMLLASLPVAAWIFGLLIGRIGQPLGTYPAYRVVMLSLLGLFLIGGVYFIIRAFQKGFPRWSFSYLPWVLILILILPAFRLSSDLMMPAYISPLLIVLILFLISVTRSWSRLGLLVHKIRSDWTLVSFSMYSLLPFFAFLISDEVEHQYFFPFGMVSFLLLVGGSLLYMYSRRLWQRILILLTAAAGSMSLISVSTNIYWHGITYDYLRSLISLLLPIMLVLLLPGILAFFIRQVRKLSPV
jgi:hypothetical protein